MSPCSVGVAFSSFANVYLLNFISTVVPSVFVIVPTGIQTNWLPFVAVSVASSITIPLSTVVASFVTLNPAGTVNIFPFESFNTVFSVSLNILLILSLVNSSATYLFISFSYVPNVDVWFSSASLLFCSACCVFLNIPVLLILFEPKPMHFRRVKKYWTTTQIHYNKKLKICKFIWQKFK